MSERPTCAQCKWWYSYTDDDSMGYCRITPYDVRNSGDRPACKKFEPSVPPKPACVVQFVDADGKVLAKYNEPAMPTFMRLMELWHGGGQDGTQ